MVYKGMNSRLIQGIKKTPTKKKRRTIKGKSMDPWIGQASKILISCKQYGLTLFTRWSWNGKLFYSSRITGTAKGHLPLGNARAYSSAVLFWLFYITWIWFLHCTKVVYQESVSLRIFLKKLLCILVTYSAFFKKMERDAVFHKLSIFLQVYKGHGVHWIPA